MARSPKIMWLPPSTVHLGDGVYRVVEPPPADTDRWVSVREAARMLGFEGRFAPRRVYPLFDDGTLRCRRVVPKRIQVGVRSIEELIKSRATAAKRADHAKRGKKGGTA